jgi:hypothetical protein
LPWSERDLGAANSVRATYVIVRQIINIT